MKHSLFIQTTIGRDWYENERTGYPIDKLLDYLTMLEKLRDNNTNGQRWKDKYDNEIEATKEVMKMQS